MTKAKRVAKKEEIRNSSSGRASLGAASSGVASSGAASTGAASSGAASSGAASSGAASSVEASSTPSSLRVQFKSEALASSEESSAASSSLASLSSAVTPSTNAVARRQGSSDMAAESTAERPASGTGEAAMATDSEEELGVKKPSTRSHEPDRIRLAAPPAMLAAHLEPAADRPLAPSGKEAVAAASGIGYEPYETPGMSPKMQQTSSSMGTDDGSTVNDDRMQVPTGERTDGKESLWSHLTYDDIANSVPLTMCAVTLPLLPSTRLLLHVDVGRNAPPGTTKQWISMPMRVCEARNDMSQRSDRGAVEVQVWVADQVFVPRGMSQVKYKYAVIAGTVQQDSPGFLMKVVNYLVPSTATPKLAPSPEGWMHFSEELGAFFEHFDGDDSSIYDYLVDKNRILLVNRELPAVINFPRFVIRAYAVSAGMVDANARYGRTARLRDSLPALATCALDRALEPEGLIEACCLWHAAVRLAHASDQPHWSYTSAHSSATRLALNALFRAVVAAPAAMDSFAARYLVRSGVIAACHSAVDNRNERSLQEILDAGAIAGDNVSVFGKLITWTLREVVLDLDRARTSNAWTLAASGNLEVIPRLRKLHGPMIQVAMSSELVEANSVTQIAQLWHTIVDEQWQDFAEESLVDTLLARLNTHCKRLGTRGAQTYAEASDDYARLTEGLVVYVTNETVQSHRVDVSVQMLVALAPGLDGLARACVALAQVPSPNRPERALLEGALPSLLSGSATVEQYAGWPRDPADWHNGLCIFLRQASNTRAGALTEVVLGRLLTSLRNCLGPTAPLPPTQTPDGYWPAFFDLCKDVTAMFWQGLPMVTVQGSRDGATGMSAPADQIRKAVCLLELLSQHKSSRVRGAFPMVACPAFARIDSGELAHTKDALDSLESCAFAWIKLEWAWTTQTASSSGSAGPARRMLDLFGRWTADGVVALDTAAPLHAGTTATAARWNAQTTVFGNVVAEKCDDLLATTFMLRDAMEVENSPAPHRGHEAARWVLLRLVQGWLRRAKAARRVTLSDVLIALGMSRADAASTARLGPIVTTVLAEYLTPATNGPATRAVQSTVAGSNVELLLQNDSLWLLRAAAAAVDPATRDILRATPPVRRVFTAAMAVLAQLESGIGMTVHDFERLQKSTPAWDALTIAFALQTGSAPGHLPAQVADPLKWWTSTLQEVRYRAETLRLFYERADAWMRSVSGPTTPTLTSLQESHRRRLQAVQAGMEVETFANMDLRDAAQSLDVHADVCATAAQFQPYASSRLLDSRLMLHLHRAASTPSPATAEETGAVSVHDHAPAEEEEWEDEPEADSENDDDDEDDDVQDDVDEEDAGSADTTDNTSSLQPKADFVGDVAHVAHTVRAGTEAAHAIAPERTKTDPLLRWVQDSFTPAWHRALEDVQHMLSLPDVDRLTLADFQVQFGDLVRLDATMRAVELQTLRLAFGVARVPADLELAWTSIAEAELWRSRAQDLLQLPEVFAVSAAQDTADMQAGPAGTPTRTGTAAGSAGPTWGLSTPNGVTERPDSRFSLLVTAAASLAAFSSQSSVAQWRKAVTDIQSRYNAVLPSGTERQEALFGLVDELSRAKDLIAFLREVTGEDLRRLANMDESAERHLQAGIVQDFVQLRRYLEDVLTLPSPQSVLTVATAVVGLVGSVENGNQNINQITAATVRLAVDAVPAMRRLHQSVGNRGQSTREEIRLLATHGTFTVHQVGTSASNTDTRQRFTFSALYLPITIGANTRSSGSAGGGHDKAMVEHSAAQLQDYAGQARLWLPASDQNRNSPLAATAADAEAADAALADHQQLRAYIAAVECSQVAAAALDTLAQVGGPLEMLKLPLTAADADGMAVHADDIHELTDVWRTAVDAALDQHLAMRLLHPRQLHAVHQLLLAPAQERLAALASAFANPIGIVAAVAGRNRRSLMDRGALALLDAVGYSRASFERLHRGLDRLENASAPATGDGQRNEGVVPTTPDRLAWLGVQLQQILGNGARTDVLPLALPHGYVPPPPLPAGRVSLVIVEDTASLSSALLGLHLMHGIRPNGTTLLFAQPDMDWLSVDLFLRRALTGSPNFGGEMAPDAAGPTDTLQPLYALVGPEHLSLEFQDRILETLASAVQRTTAPAPWPLALVVVRGPASDNLCLAIRESLHVRVAVPPALVLQAVLRGPAFQHITLVTARCPGLGKTEMAAELCSRQSLRLATVSLVRNVNAVVLLEAVQRTAPRPDQALHLNLADVGDRAAVEPLLFELVLLGRLWSANECLPVLVPAPLVVIEMAAAEGAAADCARAFPVLGALTHVHLTGDPELVPGGGDVETPFAISPSPLDPIRIVCAYLHLLEEPQQNGFRTTQLAFPMAPGAITPAQQLPPATCKALLRRHFFQNSLYSYNVLNVFAAVAARQLVNLANSVYFRIDVLADTGAANPSHVIWNVAMGIIQLSRTFAIQSLVARAEQREQLSGSARTGVPGATQTNTPSATTDEVRLALGIQHTSRMVKWEQSRTAMVVFHQDDSNTIQVVIRRGLPLPTEVRQLLTSQRVAENQLDLDLASQGKLTEWLFKLVCAPGQRGEAPSTAAYALTPDNFVKMVMIGLRVDAGLPVLLMGETGAGKTSLIASLAGIAGARLQILNVHSGTTADDVRDAVVSAECKLDESAASPLWLFLDEVNTSSVVGFISELLSDRRMDGRPLRPELTLLAACNPYRIRPSARAALDPRAGNVADGRGLAAAVAAMAVDRASPSLRWSLRQQAADPFAQLVYRVYPLPDTLLDYVWDYGVLPAKDEQLYIERMVRSTTLPASCAALPVQSVTRHLALAQEFARERADGWMVSLRDVRRCLTLMAWFAEHLQESYEVTGGTGGQTSLLDASYHWATRRVRLGWNRRSSAGRPAVVHRACTPEETTARAVALALSVCYLCRHRNAQDRHDWSRIMRDLWRAPESPWPQGSDPHEYMRQEMESYMRMMVVERGVAPNEALREMVFVTLVCICNRIPLFIVDDPGCGKSLTLALIDASCRGTDSKNPFLQRLPALQIIPFQGSDSSTSEGLLKVFKRAEDEAKIAQNQSYNVRPVVLLDEVGLAELSPHNPLKVLHAKLEPGVGEVPAIAVVGISNWALDPAKMSRAVYLSRPPMTQEDLVQTAEAIFFAALEAADSADELEERPQSAFDDRDRRVLDAVAAAYMDYGQHQHQQFGSTLHGLRDFYALVKALAGIRKRLIDRRFALTGDGPPDGTRNPSVAGSVPLPDQLSSTAATEQMLRNPWALALQRNFSGRPRMINNAANELPPYLQRFLGEAADTRSGLPVVDLIRENLQDRAARHLLLIVRGADGVALARQALEIALQAPTVSAGAASLPPRYFVGSRFEADDTDDYRYRILQEIILCMGSGRPVVLTKLDRIYSSLYDMLNQRYTVYGQHRQKSCRIALGAYANPMCVVDDRFRCVVVMSEDEVRRADPPFLNRFEKYHLTQDDLLTERQRSHVSALREWVMDISRGSGRASSWTFGVADCLVGANAGDGGTGDLLATLVLNGALDATVHDLKIQLIQVATADAVIRARFSALGAKQPDECTAIQRAYFDGGQHDSLASAWSWARAHITPGRGVRLVVLTFSPVLEASGSRLDLGGGVTAADVVHLGSVKAERELVSKLSEALTRPAHSPLVLRSSGAEDADILKHALFCVDEALVAESSPGTHDALVLVHVRRDDDLGTLPVFAAMRARWSWTFVDSLASQRAGTAAGVGGDSGEVVDVLSIPLSHLRGRSTLGAVLSGPNALLPLSQLVEEEAPRIALDVPYPSSPAWTNRGASVAQALVRLGDAGRAVLVEQIALMLDETEIAAAAATGHTAAAGASWLEALALDRTRLAVHLRFGDVVRYHLAHSIYGYLQRVITACEQWAGLDVAVATAARGARDGELACGEWTRAWTPMLRCVLFPAGSMQPPLLPSAFAVAGRAPRVHMPFSPYVMAVLKQRCDRHLGRLRQQQTTVAVDLAPITADLEAALNELPLPHHLLLRPSVFGPLAAAADLDDVGRRGESLSVARLLAAEVVMDHLLSTEAATRVVAHAPVLGTGEYALLLECSLAGLANLTEGRTPMTSMRDWCRLLAEMWWRKSLVEQQSNDMWAWMLRTQRADWAPMREAQDLATMLDAARNDPPEPEEHGAENPMRYVSAVARRRTAAVVTSIARMSTQLTTRESLVSLGAVAAAVADDARTLEDLGARKDDTAVLAILADWARWLADIAGMPAAVSTHVSAAPMLAALADSSAIIARPFSMWEAMRATVTPVERAGDPAVSARCQQLMQAFLQRAVVYARLSQVPDFLSYMAQAALQRAGPSAGADFHPYVWPVRLFLDDVVAEAQATEAGLLPLLCASMVQGPEAEATAADSPLLVHVSRALDESLGVGSSDEAAASAAVVVVDDSPLVVAVADKLIECIRAELLDDDGEDRRDQRDDFFSDLVPQAVHALDLAGAARTSGSGTGQAWQAVCASALLYAVLERFAQQLDVRTSASRRRLLETLNNAVQPDGDGTSPTREAVLVLLLKHLRHHQGTATLSLTELMALAPTLAPTGLDVLRRIDWGLPAVGRPSEFTWPEAASAFSSTGINTNPLAAVVPAWGRVDCVLRQAALCRDPSLLQSLLTGDTEAGHNLIALWAYAVAVAAAAAAPAGVVTGAAESAQADGWPGHDGAVDGLDGSGVATLRRLVPGLSALLTSAAAGSHAPVVATYALSRLQASPSATWPVMASNADAQAVWSVVIHCGVAAASAPPESLLAALLHQPDRCGQQFMPGMPHSVTCWELLGFLLVARDTTASPTITRYLCACGMPYIVENCGHRGHDAPAGGLPVAARCRQCNAEQAGDAAGRIDQTPLTLATFEAAVAAGGPAQPGLADDATASLLERCGLTWRRLAPAVFWAIRVVVYGALLAGSQYGHSETARLRALVNASRPADEPLSVDMCTQMCTSQLVVAWRALVAVLQPLTDRSLTMTVAAVHACVEAVCTSVAAAGACTTPTERDLWEDAARHAVDALMADVSEAGRRLLNRAEDQQRHVGITAGDGSIALEPLLVSHEVEERGRHLALESYRRRRYPRLLRMRPSGDLIAVAADVGELEEDMEDDLDRITENALDLLQAHEALATRHRFLNTLLTMWRSMRLVNGLCVLLRLARGVRDSMEGAMNRRDALDMTLGRWVTEYREVAVDVATDVLGDGLTASALEGVAFVVETYNATVEKVRASKGVADGAPLILPLDCEVVVVSPLSRWQDVRAAVFWMDPQLSAPLCALLAHVAELQNTLLREARAHADAGSPVLQYLRRLPERTVPLPMATPDMFIDINLEHLHAALRHAFPALRIGGGIHYMLDEIEHQLARPILRQCPTLACTPADFAPMTFVTDGLKQGGKLLEDVARVWQQQPFQTAEHANRLVASVDADTGIGRELMDSLTLLLRQMARWDVARQPVTSYPTLGAVLQCLEQERRLAIGDLRRLRASGLPGQLTMHVVAAFEAVESHLGGHIIPRLPDSFGALLSEVQQKAVRDRLNGQPPVDQLLQTALRRLAYRRLLDADEGDRIAMWTLHECLEQEGHLKGDALADSGGAGGGSSAEAAALVLLRTVDPALEVRHTREVHDLIVVWQRERREEASLLTRPVGGGSEGRPSAFFRTSEVRATHRPGTGVPAQRGTAAPERRRR